MAWTRKLKSGRWQGQYRDETNTIRSAGTFEKRKAAMSAAVAAEDEAQQREPRPDITWGEWEKRWTPSRTVEDSTLAADASRIDRHLLPRWGDVPLADITHRDIQAWVNMLAESSAPTTVKKVGHCLSASLKAALRDELIDSNPAANIKYPKSEPSPERWLSTDEVAAVRELMPDDYLLTFDLLVGSGLRWGEAVGLHWDQVDLDKGLIVARWSWDRGRVFKAPKSDAKRTVPIGDSLVASLISKLSVDGLGVSPDFEYRGHNRPLHGLVLAGASGRPPESRRFALALSAAGKAARVGVPARVVGHIRPHDLRHTYASLLVQNGISLSQVQKILGHSSSRVTERYASAGTAQWDDVRSVLG